MQAIETKYKGYRFRSRLEARWAVFFDALGIPWEYEVEGYKLPSGWYLPDFVLWGSVFVEVKPGLEDGCGSWDLCPTIKMIRGQHWAPMVQDLVRGTERDLIVCIGTPTVEALPFCWYYEEEGFAWDWGTWAAINEQRIWIDARCEDLRPTRDSGCAQWPGIEAALQQSRGARFEHGESGAVPARPRKARRADPLLEAYARAVVAPRDVAT